MPEIIRIVRTIDDPRLEVGLPSKTFRENRKWLKSAVPGKQIRPDWDAEARCWRVAKANFTDLVRAMADKYGTVRVVVEYNPKMVCTDSCRNATRDDCECSCLGRSHGGGRWLEGWKDLGEIAVGHEGRTRIAYDATRGRLGPLDRPRRRPAGWARNSGTARPMDTGLTPAAGRRRWRARRGLGSSGTTVRTVIASRAQRPAPPRT